MKQVVEDENTKILQPSFPLHFNESMCEKSALEDLFGAVNCMRLEEFYSRNFQPLLSLFFAQFMIKNSAGKYVLNAEICMGQKCFQFMASCENFQPHMEGQQVLN